MIIFGPCIKDDKLYAEEGPFITIVVDPVTENDTTIGRQKHKVVVHIRTELLNHSQLEKRVNSPTLPRERRFTYRVALEEMDKLQRQHRKIKRKASKLPEESPEKPLKATKLTISDDLADTLTLADAKTRETIAMVAMMELAGISQASSTDYTDAVYNVGHKLALAIRRDRPTALWLDGLQNVRRHFEEAQAVLGPKRVDKPRGRRARAAGPRQA